MKTFAIYEYGSKFATIEARTATSALKKAAKAYPRRAEDYNMADDATPTRVEWRAIQQDNLNNFAESSITVPGIGLGGCGF